MKKSYKESGTEDLSSVSGLNDKKIFEELELAQRTQVPPSEEEVARLNEIASKPPFSDIHKVKEHRPR
jgi:hypothetical protein